ncbi:UvrD-helicase domain-containing protein [Natronosalvus amylolyticus]|uniref:UvrD-helicase domain-containing protein n=1 Tax=Natronosalvus amylolyticus TaxID=2961994 RepID=UPI0020C998E8|nr:UvrD-helicase domain-containing protein [Natronosalvus amylolyticus]
MADKEGEPSVPRGNQPAVIDSDAACISVDAGAGTGKTTTMLMRLERTLADEGTDPSDILVLTFANEAASNIRSSIANRLDPAIAAEIDVYTYHSFCHRLVREYAYYLGLSPSFDIVTERDRYRLVRRLLTERDYAFVDETAGSSEGATPETLADAVDEFIAVMSRDDIDPDTLEGHLPDARTIDLLDELLLWLRQEAASGLSFDNEAFRFFNRDEHLEDARGALVEYGKLLTFCREKIAEAPADFREDGVVRDVERYLRSLQSCVTNVHESLTLDDPTTKHLAPVLFRNQLWREQTATIEQTPIGRLEHYIGVLREARQYTAIYRDYRELQAEEGTLDFDELVRTATRLLSDETVADEIAAEYTHVYCDEFQDTDRTQYQLVSELTTGPDRPELLAIGDTDQAIYGWRGTDPHGLERLGDAYTDHESVELGLNYRSKQEILDLTNYCDYGGHSSKTLREYGRKPDGSTAPVSSKDTDSTRHVVKVDSDELGWSTPEQVGMTVARLLTDEFDGVAKRRLEDIAVIVRTNAQASAVADELEARQIPYEQSGSPAGTVSPGVQTLLSYLRVIAEPSENDTHLRRVLLLRYRLSETDLERLHELDTDGLYSALLETDPERVDEPERIERARIHLRSLVADRDAYPLSPFLERFEERTRMKWFLGPDDDRALDRLHRFVDAYDGGDVLGSLSPRVVDALESVLRSGSSDRQQGTTSTDSVDIMTVHQAKGLQFDTVLVPFLSDEHWCVRGDYAYSSRHRLLSAALDPAIDTPLASDLATEPLAEAWRVLHVALTRAEDHLFVFGSEYDYEGDENALGRSVVEACLAADLEWSVAGERMDLWPALTASFERLEAEYPESVVDATAELAEADASVGGMVSYDDGETMVSTPEALETITTLGAHLRSRRLLPAADAAPYTEAFDVPKTRRLGATVDAATRFSVTDVSSLGDSTIPGALRHSYSALETHAECPRKHYLDHVVGAFDDSVAGVQAQANGGEADTAPPPSRADGNARLVGTVFHAVAEAAFYRNENTPEAWHEAATRELTARGERGHEEAVQRCIDRYFEATTPAFDVPFHEWDELAAELAFEVDDVPGIDGAVIGYIDTVRRLPDGRLGVFDYKTVGERIEPAMATQLSLYARACARQFDEPVDAVGYVYVGDVDSTRVDHVSLEEIPSWESVLDTLEAVDDPRYDETNPGHACRFCTHHSLGCAELPDEQTGG